MLNEEGGLYIEGAATYVLERAQVAGAHCIDGGLQL
jgi:hypothetical protein